MKSLFQKFFERFVQVYLVLVLIWIFVAFSFDCYMLYLSFSGQEEKALEISTELWRRIDYNYR